MTSLAALSQITEGSTIIDSVNRNECVALQTGVTGRSVVVSNVLMCPVLTRNRLSECSQNIHATQPPTDGVMRVFTATRHTPVTVKQRPRDDNERHSTHTLNALKQKQCQCLLLYNSVRFPEKKGCF